MLSLSPLRLRHSKTVPVVVTSQPIKPRTQRETVQQQFSLQFGVLVFCLFQRGSFIPRL